MEDFKPFFDAIEDLKEKSRKGWVIIVEGKKDVDSLRMLGVVGEIITFSGFATTADAVGNRDVIILTDYDTKGLEIERGLVKALQTYGKTPDTEIKRRIFCNVRKEISRVEEIHSFFEKLRAESNRLPK